MSKYLKEIIIFYFVLTLHTLYSQELTTFAVFNLKNFGILESESAIISERLRDILVSLNKYRVLERENMDEILNEQGFQLSGCTTNECAVEAGKLLNVNKIISVVCRCWRVSYLSIRTTRSNLKLSVMYPKFDVMSGSVFYVYQAL